MSGFNIEDYLKRRRGKYTFYLRSSYCADQSEFMDRFAQALLGASQENYNAFEKVGDQPSFFVKARVLRHRNHRLKATLVRFGLFHSSPEMAEISNNLQIVGVPYIPKLVAFGYEKGRSGMIKKVLVATEYREHTVTLREFIEANPSKTFQAVMCAFKLIQRMLDDNITHLDFWIENILTNSDLSELWLIDLEYCKINSKAPIDERLAFCVGYLYSYRLRDYLDMDDYFELAQVWLTEYTGANANVVLQKALLSVDAPLSRKDRLAVF